MGLFVKRMVIGKEKDSMNSHEEIPCKKLNLPEGHPYAYETHLHTKQGSACGRSDTADMVRACKQAGYTGMFVSDHFFYGNTAVDRSLPWKEWVEGYCKGYEIAKEEGDKIGLQVFFAWEASYQGTDFLIYGLDKQWLIDHPEIKDATIEEQYKLVHADGGMVIHAHPYREASYIPEARLFPEWVDGVEVRNASHTADAPSRPDFDEKALAYAQKYDFPQTAGSDIHSVNLSGGGMAFTHKLESVQDYIDAIKNKEGVLLPLSPAFVE